MTKENLSVDSSPGATVRLTEQVKAGGCASKLPPGSGQIAATNALSDVYAMAAILLAATRLVPLRSFYQPKEAQIIGHE